MRQYRIVEGFHQPLHNSLTEPMLFLGVPKNLAILNGTLAVIELIMLKSWYILPMNLIVHLIAVYVHSKDSRFFDCFKDYLRTKERYFPQ